MGKILVARYPLKENIYIVTQVIISVILGGKIYQIIKRLDLIF